MITFNTNMGAFKINLFTDKAPETCANFLSYCTEGFYEGTIFHRVIDGFMIQGGGFDAAMSQKSTKAALKNEADNGLANKIGTLAMARTNDPHSATCQFFINVNNNDFLNFTGKTSQGWGYCVFAEIADGMDVIENITKVKTQNAGMHADVPVDAIIIESVVVEE